MNWECNRCGYRVQPINKKVKPDGMAWPAGSACSRCLNGEIVYREYNTIISLASVMVDKDTNENL